MIVRGGILGAIDAYLGRPEQEELRSAKETESPRVWNEYLMNLFRDRPNDNFVWYDEQDYVMH